MELTIELINKVRTMNDTTTAEKEWALAQITCKSSFVYVANPSNEMKWTLEAVFGPLDWNIPYV